MYTEIPSGLSSEQAAICSEVHRFGAEVLRPASLRLDRLRAEEVVAKGSPLWDVFRAWYGLGNHAASLPECYGGLEFDPATQHGVYEEMGWAAADLAAGGLEQAAELGAAAGDVMRVQIIGDYLKRCQHAGLDWRGRLHLPEVLLEGFTTTVAEVVA